jgi:hypothetical protein
MATLCTMVHAAYAAPATPKIHDDDVVGVAVELQPGWNVKRDPVLLDTHGFAIYAEASEDGKKHTGHQRDAIARVAVAYKAQPHQLNELVATKLKQYKEHKLQRSDIVIGGGVKAVAITGLPGTQPYSIVYATHGNQVYEIGLWSDKHGIDARGKAVLDKLQFKPAMRSVESLGLKDAKLRGRPPMQQQIRNAEAEAKRKAKVQAARASGALSDNQVEEYTPPVAASIMMSSSAGHDSSYCGFTAPSSMYWQLQWDDSNTFYSGSWYNLKSEPGWSAMSGNYGSWWGENYHIRKCSHDYANQYFANDWPGQHWANAYAAFSGYVEWADWGTDGFYTLGYYVVVRNGYYRSLTAHLSAIAEDIYWGVYVDAYWKVIGWIGDTGGDWDPHIHGRVSWNESLTYNGQPYGGHSVRPNYLRCFNCTDHDYTNSNGGKSYTQFWHGRWMMY